MRAWNDTYFADYDAYSENEIAAIDQKGISLKNSKFIDFSVCAANFKKAHPEIGNNKCVGEREITDFSFTFYADPKPIMIQFIPHHKIIEFFTANNTVKRFYTFQQKIRHCGYGTYDVT